MPTAEARMYIHPAIRALRLSGVMQPPARCLGELTAGADECSEELIWWRRRELNRGMAM